MGADNYFGACPRCLGNDGFVNIGSGHWFFCKRHRTMWPFGFNVFSGWRDETEEEQRKICDELGLDGFTEVKPVNVFGSGRYALAKLRLFFGLFRPEPVARAD